MDKKYTYFISSTFRDLIEERKIIANYILKIDEIPIGMEQFGAIDTSQWSYIKKLIDTSDFFILIVAGKYGSIDHSDPDELSYTHKEFRYAREQRIPIIAAVHKHINFLPVDFSETDQNRQTKLENFRNEVGSARLIAHYANQSELLIEIASSISKGKAMFNRPGWIRNIIDQDYIHPVGPLAVYTEHNKLLVSEIVAKTALLEKVEGDRKILLEKNKQIMTEYENLTTSYNLALEKIKQIPDKDLLIDNLKKDINKITSELEDHIGNALGGLSLIDFDKDIDMRGKFRLGGFISEKIGAVYFVISKIAAFFVVAEEVVLKQDIGQINYLNPQVSHGIVKRLYSLSGGNTESYDLMIAMNNNSNTALVDIFLKEKYFEFKETGMLCFTAKGRETYDYFKKAFDRNSKRISMHKDEI